MTSKQKFDVAKQLAKRGVDIIETGFPAASKDDFEAVKMISKEVANAMDADGYVPVICGLSRCKETDIRTAWEAVKYAKRPRIHAFIASSAIHMEHKLRKSEEQGARAGARQLEVTINGIGERAGNASLEEPHKALVGASAFAHESGNHQDGMFKHKGTDEIISPEEIGFERSSKVVLGNISVRHVLRDRLKERVTDDDLIALVSDEVFQAKPISTVRLISIDGHEHIACSVGTGPVDSAYKVVELIVKEPVTLLEYSLNAVTEGIDAIATTRVLIRGENSCTSTQALTGESIHPTFSGSGAGMDIVVSSVKAYIAALNKLLGIKETSGSAEKTAFSL
ncbi:hypothetical protein L6164_013465 [Bauhinia variegata]|uniref:Uncharacterized protein n=1 Tax=Bauhinia variegata TaxID=167791 RepID=A0ACB9NE40_BAUVA|nr:hypothetical protein L6164_013465 [Bauhinia variegata]